MNILIVDDDPDICVMMRILLQAEGWTTEEVTSGQEALQRLDEISQFDVLVLDYRMPGLTGIELARNLREESTTPPMIMCSAYLNPEIEDEAKELGVPTVSKADLKLLVEMIRAHAGSRSGEYQAEA
jgi:CheY-like chemotaxis protein